MFYSATQFAIFRIIFGVYLACHFASLIQYGPTLFGATGMIPNPQLSPSAKVIPASWFIYESDGAIKLFLSTLTVSSMLFAFGIWRRVCSLFLWYGWAYLFNRNVLIANPGLAYVGWLLLACSIIPEGEGFSLYIPRDLKWKMPSIIYWSAWVLMALGYTISGIHKLQCPSWLDGTALYHVLNGVLARDNLIRNLLVDQFPGLVLQGLTWASLIVEILFLPIGIFDRVRKWYWLIVTGMQLGILSVVNFTDLTFGVLMVHFFTFDHRWLKEKPFKWD